MSFSHWIALSPLSILIWLRVYFWAPYSILLVMPALVWLLWLFTKFWNQKCDSSSFVPPFLDCFGFGGVLGVPYEFCQMPFLHHLRKSRVLSHSASMRHTGSFACWALLALQENPTWLCCMPCVRSYRLRVLASVSIKHKAVVSFWSLSVWLWYRGCAGPVGESGRAHSPLWFSGKFGESCCESLLECPVGFNSAALRSRAFLCWQTFG